MKIILNEDLKNLGNKGDIVEVADGYGRNYLLPRGLAQEATDGNIRQAKKRREQLQRREEEQRSHAEGLRGRLEGGVLEYTAKAGEKGRLFGAVTGKDLSEKIQEVFGLVVDKKKIEMDENIKTLGDHTVRVRLYPQVTASLTVRVSEEAPEVPEETPEAPEETPEVPEETPETEEE